MTASESSSLEHLQLPEGTVSFLFTDIEASTVRWELRPEAMRAALAHHDALLAEVVTNHSGVVFKHTGDGMGAAFSSSATAVAAAATAQVELQRAVWPDNDRLKVRMGVHTGVAEPSGDDYFGPTVNRAARIMDVCNGDQIAVSGSVVELVDDVEFVSMGEHRLRGIGTEEVSLVVDPRFVPDDRPLRVQVPSRGRQVPTTQTTLIGRTDDLSVAESLLDTSRLLTITGPAGVGKTQVAQELARSVAQNYDEAPAYCELASVDDELGVAAVVAGALGARQQPDLDLIESIVHYCAGRRILLVLDNCEHVIAAVGTIADRLLAQEGPQVLATSRERIGSSQEQLLPLDPLPADSHGLDLFVTRARERDPHFQPDANAMSDVARLCERLDGIPAAIEIAAARARVMSPAQLLERLNDAFERGIGVADSSWLGTLHETVRWSFEQLEPEAADTFARLAVFADGFSLEAAEAVCTGGADPDVLDTLLSLVDKSMVIPERGGDRVRFRLLETIRSFGLERLRTTGIETAAKQRHSEYFTALVAAGSEALLTSKESEVWNHLRQDWSNLRTAFEWLKETSDLGLASELVVGLGWFSTHGMHFEAFDWAAALLAEAEPPVLPRRTELLSMAAVGAYYLGDPAAQELAESAIAADPGEPSGLARAALASVYLNNLHALADGGAATESWLSVADENAVSDVFRLWAMAMRVFHLSLNGDPAGAEVSRDMARLAHTSGSASAIALARWAEGLSLAVERRIPDALATWLDGRDTAESLSSQHLLVHMLNGLLAYWMALAGEVRDILLFCQRALEDAIGQHFLAGTSQLFSVTAIGLSGAGSAEVGASLLGAMEANGYVPREPALPTLRGELGDRFGVAADAGRLWTIYQAGEVALDAVNAALAALEEEDE